MRLQRDLKIQEVACGTPGPTVGRTRQAVAGRDRSRGGAAGRGGGGPRQPLLRDYAAHNEKLAERHRTWRSKLAARSKPCTTPKRNSNSCGSNSGTQGPARKHPLTKTLKLSLRKQESSLPDLRKYRQNIRTRQQTIEDVRYELFELDEERNDLAQPERIVGEILRGVPPGLTEAERRELQAAAEAALERKRKYLDAAIRNQNAFFDKLTELDTTEQQLVNLTEEDFDSYIRERVLWIRTSKPLSAELAISDSDLWLVNPAVARGRPANLERRPGQPDLGRRGCRSARGADCRAAADAVAGARDRRVGSAPQLHPIPPDPAGSGAVTLVIGLLWPAATWYASWRLATAPNGSDLVNALATGLWLQAWAFFPVELLRQICRPRRLAEAHFGWPAASVERLRANVMRLMVMGMPLVFVTTVLNASDPDRGYDVAERICFILVCCIVSRFMARVLHPIKGVLGVWRCVPRAGSTTSSTSGIGLVSPRRWCWRRRRFSATSTRPSSSPSGCWTQFCCSPCW